MNCLENEKKGLASIQQVQLVHLLDACGAPFAIPLSGRCV